GKLTVRVSGIPGGASATVAVSKVGGGFSQNLTFSSNGSQSLVVPVGKYNIAANPFTVGADTYAGTVSESPVTVTGASTKEVTVSYRTNTGRLQVNVNGLPSGLPPGSDEPITINGPSGSITLGSSQTLTGLAPGSYTVTAANVSKDGSTYAGTVTTSPVTVPAGATATVDVSYSTTTGRLVVNIGGLPSGTNASITVSGPGGFNQTITASTTFDDRQPGTYTITATGGVVSQSTTDEYYQGNNTTATVTAGSSASASVTYSKHGSGKLWVIEYNTNRLLGYDQAAGTPTTLDLGLSSGQKVRGLALDKSGNLWVGIGP
ncbi:hypothetical protein GN073_08535, partial [Helicobacter pylori]|nr:hypothetical protein [Helicobacter pylori]